MLRPTEVQHQKLDQQSLVLCCLALAWWYVHAMKRNPPVSEERPGGRLLHEIIEKKGGCYKTDSFFIQGLS